MTLGRGFTGITLSESEAVTGTLAARHTPGYSDEVGNRVLVLNDRKVPALELLRFHKTLTASAGFEVALRRRVERLRQFRDPSFAPAPAVEYVGDSGLILLAAHTPGRRLSDVLEHGRAPSFAVGLIRQLTPALAALHHHDGDGIGHGALSPGRVMILPQGRLLIVEHVLGTALERLQFSAARMHLDLGITLPPTPTGIRPRPDAQTDLYQLGLIALALLLGRPVSRTEYPPQASDALAEVAGSLEPDLAHDFRQLRRWLERALKIDRKSFSSSDEAVEALQDLPAIDPDRMAAQWKEIAGIDAQPPEETESAEIPTEQAAPRPEVTSLHAVASDAVAPDPVASESVAEHGAPALEARLPEAESASEEAAEPEPDPIPVVFLTPEPEIPDPALPTIAPAADMALVGVEESVGLPADGKREALWARGERMKPRASTMPRLSWSRIGLTKPRPYLKWAVAALLLCAVAEGFIIASLLRRGLPPALPPQATEIKVETPDPGAAVVVDGIAAGVTPLQLKISPEVRSLSILASRPQPVTVGSTGVEDPTAKPAETGAKPRAAGAIAITPPPQRAGGIRLVSPIELDVFEGDARLGSSATGIVSAAVGRRELELVNSALGYRTRQTVDVKAGQVTALTITPPNGRININAQPWAEVLIDGKPVGETPIGNLSLPLGEHEIVFRHPKFPEQRRKVTIRLDSVARISATMER